MIHIKDLREYLCSLAGIGELQEIEEEVDWNLELSAVIRRCYDLKAPAPLFNKIKGIENGFRVLGGSAGLSRNESLRLCRIAISLGLSPHAGAREIINTLASSISKKGIPPKTVNAGVCQENTMTGTDVDLMRFPSPFIHQRDGGRYINTWGTIIVQTPDRSWTNWSITRIMLMDKNRMTGLVVPMQHIGIIHQMWKEQGKPMPFALAVGCEPAVPFFSSTHLPEFVDEADVLGAHFGEPIEVVPCKTVDLKVPATCEIVIEGTISPTETVSEGPMGEFAGYTGDARPQPIFNVSAITYRSNPILPVVVAGVPVEDTHTCCGTVMAAMVLAELWKQDFPAASCFCLFESALHWLIVTLHRPSHSEAAAKNLVHMAKEIIFKSKAGLDIPKVILLDDDIDPSNVNEVVWAFATRCHPDTDSHFYRHESTLPLIHYLTMAEKKDASSTKVVYNGLLPAFDRSEISSFKYSYPTDIQEKVVSNWKKFGFSE
jgi:UbiD family decarboxylase